MSAGMPSRKGLALRMSLAFIVAFFLVTIDQWTKNEAAREFLEWSHPDDPKLYRSASRALLKVPPESGSIGRSNFVDANLTYLRNPGAAWGMFSETDPKIRSAFFSAVTILVMGFILWEIKNQARVMSLTNMAYACLLGGALGNALDRWNQGYVTDWIHFEWKLLGWDYSFPVFNAADIFINIGVLLLLVGLIVPQEAKRANAGMNSCPK